MNSHQNDSIMSAIATALRAGFSIHIDPDETGGVVVTVGPSIIFSGKASARLATFHVAKRELRDALGNALQPVLCEVAADGDEQRRRLAAG